MTNFEMAPEQISYSELLRWSGWFGLGVLVVAFGLYVGGVLDPVVPVEQLPQVWRLPAGELLARTGREPGWGWALMLARGDMLNLLGISILAGCSVVPLGAIAVVYLRRGERTYAALCVLEIAVLVLAASGLVGTGH
jgi:hypothetical protein